MAVTVRIPYAAVSSHVAATANRFVQLPSFSLRDSQTLQMSPSLARPAIFRRDFSRLLVPGFATITCRKRVLDFWYVFL